jgi:hypothetical protein
MVIAHFVGALLFGVVGVIGLEKLGLVNKHIHFPDEKAISRDFVTCFQN